MTSADLVGFVHNPQIPEAAGLVAALVDSLGLRDRSWTSSAADVGGLGDRLERTSLVVIAGGDGTILRTVRAAAPYEIPMVGINMGRVGFMAELTVEEAADKLPDYVSGRLRVEERMMLQASVSSDPSSVSHGLNDVVMGSRGIARLLEVETAVDGVSLTTYRADSLIVATATGSTGYALSAGGPMVYPEARMMIVQPVAAHVGLRDCLILHEDAVVELKAVDGHDAIVSVDGFQNISIGPGDSVKVRRSPYVARFLRAQPPSAFFGALTRHPRVRWDP